MILDVCLCVRARVLNDVSLIIPLNQQPQMSPQSILGIAKPCVCNRQLLFELGQHVFLAFEFNFSNLEKAQHSWAGIWMVLASFGFYRSQITVHPSVCSRTSICTCTPIAHFFLGLSGMYIKCREQKSPPSVWQKACPAGCVCVKTLHIYAQWR